MKILVIGLNPANVGGVKSRSIKVLHGWLDRLDLKYVSFINLSEQSGKFLIKNINKDYVLDVCSNYQKILALGITVGSILGDLHIPHFKLPHPSGLNRQLNDSGYVQEKLNSCRKYLYGGNHEIL